MRWIPTGWCRDPVEVSIAGQAEAVACGEAAFHNRITGMPG